MNIYEYMLYIYIRLITKKNIIMKKLKKLIIFLNENNIKYYIEFEDNDINVNIYNDENKFENIIKIEDDSLYNIILNDEFVDMTFKKLKKIILKLNK